MADFGLFVGFGIPARNREEGAVTVFQELIGLMTSQVEQGRLESFEPVFLQPHGGDLSGFVLARGNRESLAALVASEEFQRFMARGQTIVENFGVVNCQFGAEVQRQANTFLADTADLR